MALLRSPTQLRAFTAFIVAITMTSTLHCSQADDAAERERLAGERSKRADALERSLDSVVAGTPDDVARHVATILNEGLTPLEQEYIIQIDWRAIASDSTGETFLGDPIIEKALALLESDPAIVAQASRKIAIGIAQAADEDCPAAQEALKAAVRKIVATLSTNAAIAVGGGLLTCAAVAGRAPLAALGCAALIVAVVIQRADAGGSLKGVVTAIYDCVPFLQPTANCDAASRSFTEPSQASARKRARPAEEIASFIRSACNLDEPREGEGEPFPSEGEGTSEGEVEGAEGEGEGEACPLSCAPEDSCTKCGIDFTCIPPGYQCLDCAAHDGVQAILGVYEDFYTCDQCGLHVVGEETCCFNRVVPLGSECCGVSQAGIGQFCSPTQLESEQHCLTCGGVLDCWPDSFIGCDP